MLRSSLIILLLAFSASASAEDFSYDYVFLGYGNVELDSVNVDGNGYSLGGSYGFTDSIHGFASYETADLDFSVDTTRYNFGVGYNTSVSDAVDMFARLSYEYLEFDVPGVGSVDDSGYGLSVGARFAASAKLELDAAVNYVDYGDGDDTGFEVGGLYNFSDAFALGLAAEWSDEFTTYALTGRFYFGR
jgi:long-subunit fatty acid transport protein